MLSIDDEVDSIACTHAMAPTIVYAQSGGRLFHGGKGGISRRKRGKAGETQGRPCTAWCMKLQAPLFYPPRPINLHRITSPWLLSRTLPVDELSQYRLLQELPGAVALPLPVPARLRNTMDLKTINGG